jgi:pimeloyl-ACP methyl ester carboxylesterase
MTSFPSFSRWAASAAILGSLGGAIAFAHAELFPRRFELAHGVRVGGVASAPGDTPEDAAKRASRRALERRVTLTWGGSTLLTASVEELGGVVDEEAIAASASAIGRRGGWGARLDEVLRARRGEIDIPVRVSLPGAPRAARRGRG